MPLSAVEQEHFINANVSGAERRLIAEAIAKKLNSSPSVDISSGVKAPGVDAPYIHNINVETRGLFSQGITMRARSGGYSVRMHTHMADAQTPERIHFGTYETEYQGNGRTGYVHGRSTRYLTELGLRSDQIQMEKGYPNNHYSVSTNDLLEALDIKPEQIQAARETARQASTRALSEVKPIAERTTIHAEGETFQKSYGADSPTSGRYTLITDAATQNTALQTLDDAIPKLTGVYPPGYDVYPFTGADGRSYVGIAVQNVETTIPHGTLSDKFREAGLRVADGVDNFPPGQYDRYQYAFEKGEPSSKALATESKIEKSIEKAELAQVQDTTRRLYVPQGMENIDISIDEAAKQARTLNKPVTLVHNGNMAEIPPDASPELFSKLSAGEGWQKVTPEIDDIAKKIKTLRVESAARGGRITGTYKGAAGLMAIVGTGKALYTVYEGGSAQDAAEAFGKTFTGDAIKDGYVRPLESVLQTADLATLGISVPINELFTRPLLRSAGYDVRKSILEDGVLEKVTKALPAKATPDMPEGVRQLITLRDEMNASKVTMGRSDAKVDGQNTQTIRENFEVKFKQEFENPESSRYILPIILKGRTPSVTADMPHALQDMLKAQEAYEGSKQRNGRYLHDSDKTPALQEAYLQSIEKAVGDQNSLAYIKAYADMRTQRDLPRLSGVEASNDKPESGVNIAGAAPSGTTHRQK